jgi:hypothetical protein
VIEAQFGVFWGVIITLVGGYLIWWVLKTLFWYCMNTCADLDDYVWAGKGIQFPKGSEMLYLRMYLLYWACNIYRYTIGMVIMLFVAWSMVEGAKQARNWWHKTD